MVPRNTGNNAYATSKCSWFWNSHTQEITFTVKSIFFFFSKKTFVSEINKFKNHLFLFSNFAGAAILNKWGVLQLPYCYNTKALCVRTIGQL